MKIFNRLIIPLIAAILIVCSSNIQWSKGNWNNIVKADGKGYYAYLPAVFIYNDLNFSFFDSIEKKYPNPHIYYDYRVEAEGKKVNKYFTGTALAMLPFFIVAHVATLISGGEVDGYYRIYPIMINLAAIIYLCIGLFYLRKFLSRYEASTGLINFTLVAITFATNVFYYTVCEPAMSHIYSFAFITMFVYYLSLFFNSPGASYFLILALVFGIIVLIRPINGLILFIAPFIAGEKNKLLDGFRYLKNQLRLTVLGIGISMAIITIQTVIYKIQTGSFWIDSYGAETFNWIVPHPIDFLISYKKGLFVYTPLAILSLLGLYRLAKQNKFQFYSLTVFLSMVLYVLSSWWSWWYGGSFSSRVSIEYYAILALLICLSYQQLKTKWIRNLYSSLIVCLLLVCQIQTYQYRYYIIHWEKMDKEHYWRVFLRIDKLGKDNPNSDLLE